MWYMSKNKSIQIQLVCEVISKGPFNQGKWVLLQRYTLNYASQEEETSYISATSLEEL